MFSKAYIIGSCIIGLLQLVEAVVAFILAGKVVAFNYIFTVIEFLWVPVAIIAICTFVSEKKQFYLYSPISYVAYNVMGWAVALTLAILDPRHPDNQRELIPMEFIVGGAIFGTYFLIANAIIWKKLSSSD